MLFKIGDLVTRKSHNHDMVFRITDIKDNIVFLKGYNVRLIADSPLEDLTLCENCEEELKKDDRDLLVRMADITNLDRDEYFYLHGPEFYMWVQIVNIWKDVWIFIKR